MGAFVPIALINDRRCVVVTWTTRVLEVGFLGVLAEILEREVAGHTASVHAHLYETLPKLVTNLHATSDKTKLHVSATGWLILSAIK